jgi:hypothetical protein
MTSEKLAWHRENGRLQDPKFDRLAKIGDKMKAKEGEKKLSIKYNSSTSDDEKIYLEFTIETPTIKSSTATIFVEEMNADNEIAVPKTIVTGLKSNSKQSFKVSFDKNKIFNRYTFQDNFSYQATVTIDGLSAKTDEFELKYEKTKPEKLEKCICKKSSWSADDLKNIVTQLRKLDKTGDFQTLRDKNNTKNWEMGEPIKDSKGNDIKIELSQYDAVATDKKQIKDRLFYLIREENLSENQRNYEDLAKQINYIFKNVGAKKCINKIHILCQIYHETERLGSTYESDTSATKSGEDFYRGGD